MVYPYDGILHSYYKSCGRENVMAWRNDHDLRRLQNSVYNLLQMVVGGGVTVRGKFYVVTALE